MPSAEYNYICVYIYIYVYMCVYVCMYMYVCMYVVELDPGCAKCVVCLELSMFTIYIYNK